jgi:hypothetical protein
MTGWLDRLQGRVFYTSFGLAWLRARKSGVISSNHYQSAPWPTPPLAIALLRALQRFAPARRAQESLIPRPEPEAFAPSMERPTTFLRAAGARVGPRIHVRGEVDFASMQRLMLGQDLVSDRRPDVSWSFEIRSTPAWLETVLQIDALPLVERFHADNAADGAAIVAVPPSPEQSCEAWARELASALPRSS